MTDIRALRLSRGLTLVNLALLADIPACTLIQIEYGLQRLDYESRMRLARVFGTQPELLCSCPTPPAAAPNIGWLRHASPALAVALGGALLLATLLTNQLPPATVVARGGSQPSTPRIAAPVRAAVHASATTPPTAMAAPPTPTQLAPPTPTQLAPTPVPRFMLAADGPHGCPLAPAAGRVVLTQGYGVGTHAPADLWGAIDLAIDSDGDGFADPDSSQDIPIFATHGGIARVFLDSWPGGNYVRVVDEQAGWSTAYAHLATVAVADGQPILDGAQIGTVGSTGMATGPHLHYEVWHGGENVDPTGLIGCG